MVTLAINVVDVNGVAAAGVSVAVRDPGSSAGPLKLTPVPANGSLPERQEVELGSLPTYNIVLSGNDYFERTFRLDHKISGKPPETSGLSMDARSPVWGLYTPGMSAGLQYSVELTASRMRPAPRAARGFPPPGTNRVADDPKGLWADRSNRLIAFSESAAGSYPVVLGPRLFDKLEGNEQERFHWSDASIDPEQVNGMTWFDIAEYGDPNGFKMLVALWTMHGAGIRTDHKVDVLFWMAPRTNIAPFAPADVYPYKRVRDPDGIVQPYSLLAYRYLGARAAGQLQTGLAYQAMAARKSIVLAMPISAFGYWGPLLAREGLHRLAREIVTYVADRSLRGRPPVSTALGGDAQKLNRVGVAGYSSGAIDAVRLFDTRTIGDLTTAYGKAGKEAEPWAKRNAALKPSLWAAPADAFDKVWKEYYSVDGFFGSNETFPSSMGKWFRADAERRLRIYATPGRMKSPQAVIDNQLSGIFPPTPPAASPPRAQEWHSSDGRATLAWMSAQYLVLPSIAFVPAVDDHHTIPRVVFSHAVAQSGFLSL